MMGFDAFNCIACVDVWMKMKFGNFTFVRVTTCYWIRIRIRIRILNVDASV